MTLAEDFGINGRGAFYESAGCLRDVIENHLFQIVALLAMEAPAGRNYGFVHDEKAKVFHPADFCFPACRPSLTTDNWVALDDIEPPFRLPSKPLDWRGFDPTRVVSILHGFVANEAIPPIDLLILPTLNDISCQPFTYRMLAGVHRFHASMAAGFEFLPSTTRGVCS